jgi:histidinol-phosphate aminotransferase
MTVSFYTLANQYVRELVPYQPGKPIKELERELGISAAIKLASNENPLGISQHALNAIQLALTDSHIYPDGAYYELKNALSHFLNIAPNCITVGNGSENILELIVKAYLARGDCAVISEYAFLTIPILISSYGATMRVAKAEHYGHDVNAMVDLIDDNTRVLFLVNPNNPTGTYVNEAQFAWLMQHVPSRVLVVVDEAYLEYIDEPDYPNAAAYLSQYPNLIISRTFSKVYGMAALRLGYAISSPEVTDILNRARLPFNVNSSAAVAGIAALEDQTHVEKTVALNKQGLHMLSEGVKALGVNYIPSVANFLTIEVNDAMNVYKQLLQEGVIVRPLGAYNLPHHLRVSTGTIAQNERFLIALSRCL